VQRVSELLQAVLGGSHARVCRLQALVLGRSELFMSEAPTPSSWRFRDGTRSEILFRFLFEYLKVQRWASCSPAVDENEEM